MRTTWSFLLSLYSCQGAWKKRTNKMRIANWIEYSEADSIQDNKINKPLLSQIIIDLFEKVTFILRPKN